MNSIVSIGPINVEIIGDDEISSLIKDELGGNIKNSSENIDLELIINSEQKFTSYHPTHYSGKDSMNFNNREYYVGYLEYLNYIVENPFDSGKISLHIQIKEQSTINKAKKKLLSLKKVEYSDNNRLVRSFILSYAVFWNIFQLALLKKNCSFIHGAIVEKNGSANVFTGTGGSGKTSLAMQLLKSKNAKYLSEDFGIISSNGIAYFNPKSLSLYRSDIEQGNSFVANAIKSLSPEMKRKWKILTTISSKNQLLKIPPLDLFDQNKINNSSKITKIFFLIRENCDSITMNKISIDELSERVTQASLVELKSLSEVLRRILANSPLSYQYKSDFDLYGMMLKITNLHFQTLNTS